MSKHQWYLIGRATIALVAIAFLFSGCDFIQRIFGPEPTNDPPVISSVAAAKATVETGETTTITASATDQNGDPLTFRWSASTGTLAQTTGETVEWTAGATPGNATVTVEVTDGIATVSDSAVLQVELPPNADPAIAAVSVDTATVELLGTAVFSVVANDPDGDVLRYAWSVSEGSLASTTGSSVSWTAPGSAGEVTATVTVTDGNGGSAQGSTTVEVFDGSISVSSFSAQPGNQSVYLSWNNPSAPGFAGVMIRRSVGGFVVSPDDGTLVYQGTGTSHTDVGLVNGQVYYFTAFAYNATGSFFLPATASAQPRAAVSAPTAPTSLGATPVSATQVSLSWSVTSNNEESIVVERRLAGGPTFSVVTTLPAATNSFADSGLSPGMEYEYRVKARNSIGDSPYSNVATALTDQPAAAPTSLSATAISEEAIGLSWQDNSDNETGFRIERKKEPGGSFALVEVVAADIESYEDSGIDSETTYTYRVAAETDIGNSAWSAEAAATTHAVAALVVGHPPLIEVGEDGTSSVLTVALASPPTATVTVTLTSSDPSEGTANPSTVELDATDWNVPVDVTVEGVDDDEDDDDVSFQIGVTAASADIRYDGLSVDALNAVNRDDDELAAPSISPAGGSYNTEQTITISSDPGSEVRYTTDGSQPSAAHGTLYTGAFTVDASATIKAVAVRTGWKDSAVASESYELVVEPPTISPAGGDFVDPVEVTLSTPTAGAEIRYTTDGGDPSSAVGTVYSGPFTVEQNATITAVASRSGWTESSVAAAVFALTVSPVSFAPNGGDITDPVELTLSTATAGAEIYYTTDGTTPTQSDMLYDPAAKPVIATSTQVKARAFRAGWNPSESVSRAFTLVFPDTAVYVAVTGDDANKGTSDAPKATISAGLAAASQFSNVTEVRVGAGHYDVSNAYGISVVPGKSIRGGYDPTDWSRAYATAADRENPTYRTVLEYTGIFDGQPDNPSRILAAEGGGIGPTTEIEGFVLLAKRATNTTTLYVADGAHPTVRSVTIEAAATGNPSVWTLHGIVVRNSLLTIEDSVVNLDEAGAKLSGITLANTAVGSNSAFISGTTIAIRPTVGPSWGIQADRATARLHIVDSLVSIDNTVAPYPGNPLYGIAGSEATENIAVDVRDEFIMRGTTVQTTGTGAVTVEGVKVALRSGAGEVENSTITGEFYRALHVTSHRLSGGSEQWRISGNLLENARDAWTLMLMTRGTASVSENSVFGGTDAANSIEAYNRGGAIEFANNLVVGGANGIELKGAYQGSYAVYHNTVVTTGDDAGEAAAIRLNARASMTITNNLLHTTAGTTRYGLYEDPWNLGVDSPAEFRNNAFVGVTVLYHDAHGFGDISDISTVNNGAVILSDTGGISSGNVEASSVGLFVDPAADNYRLTPSAPASLRSGGLDVRPHVDSDLDANPRPGSDSAFSIGAYEFE